MYISFEYSDRDMCDSQLNVYFSQMFRYSYCDLEFKGNQKAA